MNARSLLLSGLVMFSLLPLIAGGCALQTDVGATQGEAIGRDTAASGQLCQVNQATPFALLCTTHGQDCANPIYAQTVTTTGPLLVSYDVPASHCSSARVKLYVDGVLVYVSGYLGWNGAPAPFSALPLSTGIINLGPVAPGTHTVGITAEGQVGGCNVGYIASWGGTLTTRSTTFCS